MDGTVQNLAEKIQTLNSEQIAEVEDFVDFLRIRAQARELTRGSAEISAAAFEKGWNDPENDVYNAL